MPDLIGRKLGKYELVERLGRGGMAEVYKAFQPGVERHVAIKVMHGHLSDNAEFVQRFQREARSIGQLQHSHIGRVIDFDVEADVYYMVMDYIQGGTLDEYLQRKGTLPTDEAVRITLQLADALAYAHQRGMIHRDIKPGNIMFMDDAHTHALLTDFGIARLLDEQQQMTMTGALVGTPNYMSPEAARGEPCDARADIYSLGVVLYELVTGRTPYAADTPYSFLMKQANEPLPPPRTLNPKVPAALEAVLLKALAKEPTARYQNATEFATALRTAQASSATITGSLPMQQPNPSRAPLALAGLGVLVVAIVTVLSLLRLGGSTPEATPALAPTATTAEVVAAAPATTLAPTATADAVAVTVPLTESVTVSDTVADTASETVATTAALTETAPFTPTDTLAAPAILTETAALTAPVVISTTPPLTTTSAPTDSTALAATAATTTTGETPALATVALTETVTPLAPASLGTLYFVDTGTTRAGGFTLALNQMRLPPAGHHYELWLVGAGDAALTLGTPTVEQGRIRYRGESDQNLLAAYERAELRIVPDDGAGAGEVALVSSQPAAFATSVRDLLVGNGEGGAGALPNTDAQLAIAIQHGGFLAEALAAEDFAEARRHAEHVINILDGETGTHYGDLNGDGQAQNPGDGYGVRTYLTDATTAVEAALAAITPTTTLQFYADRVTAAQQNSQSAIEQAIEVALKVFAADTVQEAQPFAAEVNARLATVRHGRDRDENGVIDPLRDEGGVVAAYDYGLRLAAYVFVGSADGAPASLTVTEVQPVGLLRFTDSAPLTTTGTSTSTATGSDGGSSDSYGSSDYGYGSSGQSAPTSTAAPIPASRFTLELNHLPLPPAGSQYVVWLTNAEGQTRVLGTLPLTSTLVLTGTTEENLLLQYNRIVITSEPAGAIPERMGEQVHFSGEHPATFMTHLQAALFSSEQYETGLLAGARDQMAIAIAHSGFLQDALDSDLAEARRHAEHIINVIEGKEGKHFGDLDGDGMAQNPGDGFGVRAYLEAARIEMTQATATMTVTTDSRFFAERYLAANDHSLALLERAYEKALQIFAADTADEARPFAAELRTLLHAALEGEDLDGNGVVDPLADEGGIAVLYEAGLLLGELPIYSKQ